MAGLALAQSLRQTALAQSGTEASSDVRFLFGTETGTAFTKPGLEAYASVWHPLPINVAQTGTVGLATHLISRSAIFPRLHSDPEEVKNKVVPHLNEILDACKATDGEATTGAISEDALVAAIKVTGVFLSTGDVEQLLLMAPRRASDSSLIEYQELVDVLLGKTTFRKGAATLLGPPVPSQVTWPADQDFTVSLRYRRAAEDFTFPGPRMAEFALVATHICQQEPSAEKVHALLRTHLMDVLVVNPPSISGGRAFRQWLAGNSVLSVTARNEPGPIPPEVYDVLDQVIYDGLGLPRATSAFQTQTSLGASLRQQQ